MHAQIPVRVSKRPAQHELLFSFAFSLLRFARAASFKQSQITPTSVVWPASFGCEKPPGGTGGPFVLEATLSMEGDAASCALSVFAVHAADQVGNHHPLVIFNMVRAGGGSVQLPSGLFL